MSDGRDARNARPSLDQLTATLNRVEAKLDALILALAEEGGDLEVSIGMDGLPLPAERDQNETL